MLHTAPHGALLAAMHESTRAAIMLHTRFTLLHVLPTAPNRLCLTADARLPVLQEFMPADVKTLALLPRRVVAGTTHVPDFFSALAVAADLLKRTAEDRKLTAARKHIILASPFTAAIEPVEDSVLVRPPPAA